MKRLVSWFLLLALLVVVTGVGCSSDTQSQVPTSGGPKPVPPKERGGKMDGVDKYTPPGK